jgi:hypothetical protein
VNRRKSVSAVPALPGTPPHPCTYPPAASKFGGGTWLVPVPPQPSCIGCWSGPVAHDAEPERA